MTIITDVIVKTLNMMKTLTLLRHAKSSWNDPSISDFYRPLKKRGKRDAQFMANKLRQRFLNIELIICSSAIRTLETATIFSDVLGLERNILKTDELYEASSNVILNTIHNINEDYRSVLIVTHNPGITNIANLLSEFCIENIPTTGIISFTFNDNWKEIKYKSCNFHFYDYPKKDER